MSKIRSMLATCFSSGCTVEDVKYSVLEALSPYFIHKESLHKFWADAEILSAFEFVVRYQYDGIFQNNLVEVMDLYRTAYKQYPNETLDIIISSFPDLSQKENIMFYKRNNIPDFEGKDSYEILVHTMEFLGNLLEVGVKPIVAELWACTKLLSKGSADYKTIRELKFGTTVQNLIDTHHLTDILRTEPQQLKLSDWRNIAYHHSYQITDESEIQCSYGKNSAFTFSMNINELKMYTGQIVRSDNILSIARILFVFDNLETIHDHCNNVSALYLSKSLEESNMETSFLSQGYRLISIEEDDNTATANFQDMLDTTSMSREEKRERWIHMSQYQMFIWKLTQKSRIVENYFTADEVNEFSCSVSGDVCSAVDSGQKDFTYVASQMSMEIKI